MAKKTTTETKDTTPKHVKNTQTGVEPKAGPAFRWYHIVSTVVVLGLVAIALVVLLSRFDISLISSRYNIKYTLGCTSSFTGKAEHSVLSYRYAGASNGMMFGENGITNNEDEAYLKIVELGQNGIKIQKRHFATKEWQEQSIRYGEENAVSIKQIPDCMPGITYTINQ